jgi:hypothetical protein
MTKKAERQSGLTAPDSIVKRMVDAAQARQDEAADLAAGKDGRGKPGHAGELGKDKTGLTKATYALPIARQALVREMAEAEDVSQTDIIEAAIIALYNTWKAGQLDFSGLKTPAKSLRFSWSLQIPDNFFSPEKPLQP